MSSQFGKISAIGAVFVAIACATAANAASVEPYAYQHLQAEAAKRGAAPVVVNLAALSMTELGDTGKTFALGALRERLLGELGDEVVSDGLVDSGVGQISLFVTEKGLAKLRTSSNAISFWPGRSGPLVRHRLLPGFRAAEAELARTGSVAISVSLRNESIAYRLNRDGSVSYEIAPRAADEHRERVGRLVSALQQRQAKQPGAAFGTSSNMALAILNAPSKPFSAVVDWRALLALPHSAEVAQIELVGYVDDRPQVLDPDALDAAKRSGVADVILSVQSPMSLTGLSAAEHGSMKRANGLAFASMLADSGSVHSFQDMSEFGVIAAQLTMQQLERLYANRDRRLLGVMLNKPLGTAALATSTAQMNLPAYRNVDSASYPEALFPDAGYRGAYPSSSPPGDIGARDPASPHVPINIIVYDTGVQRSHPMLAGKVVFEACFGSNADLVAPNGQITQYRSVCLNQVSPIGPEGGDSPLNNQPGYGNPSPLGMDCVNSAPANVACSHGTHVAGIAAGDDLGTQIRRRGVAPSARVIAVQVFSYDNARIQAPQFFAVDLLRGLQAAANAMNQSIVNNDYVVNMSLGGGQYAAPCTAGPAPFAQVPPHPTMDAFVTAVETLRLRGVPVVAGTGNDAGRAAIAFPACIPGVVKVVAAVNDAAGNTLAAYSNLPNPSTIGNEIVLMAPGGLSAAQFPVVSAWIAPLQQYSGIAGTSMAAPHVAGLYALVKAGFKKLNIKKPDGTEHNLQDVTNWIIGSASTPLQFNVAAQGQSADIRTFRRVRLP